MIIDFDVTEPVIHSDKTPATIPLKQVNPRLIAMNLQVIPNVNDKSACDFD